MPNTGLSGGIQYRRIVIDQQGAGRVKMDIGAQCIPEADVFAGHAVIM